jgi:predicted  nucleic acid-binding Zn-ribbon protein
MHREIVDLKQTIEKLTVQMRTRETGLKQSREELKLEKTKGETIRREHRQISADAKANERYVKCVQIEYELLRNMTAKSQEAISVVGIESTRVAAEFDKTSKLVKKQLKDIGEKNTDIGNLEEEMKHLHAEIVNQRASTGVTANSLKHSMLELGED